MIRFIVCVDIDNDDINSAYAELFEVMKGVEWESTDENYIDGVLIPPAAIEAVRIKKFFPRDYSQEHCEAMLILKEKEEKKC